MDISLGWLIIGFLGQIFFSARFILQWIYSEINKKSIIPLGFWFFSILGGITLLIYAIHRKDPVFIMGQATGLFIYARNLYFINKQHKISLNFRSVLKKIRTFFQDLFDLISKKK
jgi:lipid-A-disaccharide synthase-like uncharacterized protein